MEILKHLVEVTQSDSPVSLAGLDFLNSRSGYDLVYDLVYAFLYGTHSLVSFLSVSVHRVAVEVIDVRGCTRNKGRLLIFTTCWKQGFVTVINRALYQLVSWLRMEGPPGTAVL